MPILRLKEISGMSTEDRTKKLGELRAELSRMRTMIHAGGAVENPTRVREIRKTIAQILTIENEYSKGIRKTSAKETKKAEPKKAKAAPSKKPQETKPE
jgi:large subunit ribosomal protein L29